MGLIIQEAIEYVPQGAHNMSRLMSVYIIKRESGRTRVWKFHIEPSGKRAVAGGKLEIGSMSMQAG